MFDILAQLNGLIKRRKVKICNHVFTLHYRLTFILLVIFAVIVGTSKYFGKPINCTSTKATEHMVDNFCWFNSYIFVPEKDGAPYGLEMHPSVALFTTAQDVRPGYKVRYLQAYQWIEVLLLLQAVLFFLPWYLWRYCWEQERVKVLSTDFSLVSLKKIEDKQRNADIVKYLVQTRFQKMNFEYSAKFVLCEVLNFANAFGQFLILKGVLGMNGGDLWNDLVTSESNHEWKSGIARVFPNLARCDVITPATGGNNYLSELCVLPANIFTTKFYIFLWFYLIGLSVLSGLALVYRGVIMVSPGFRIWLLKKAGKGLDENCISSVKFLGYSDWFLLDLVGKNMDPFSFKILVKEFNDGLVLRRNNRTSLVNVTNDNKPNPDFSMMHTVPSITSIIEEKEGGN